MRGLLILCFTFYFSSESCSQDWSLLRSDRMQRYVGPKFSFGAADFLGIGGYTLKYDSVKSIGADSIYFVYRMVSYLDTSLCGPPPVPFFIPPNPTSTSRLAWIGTSALKRANGVHVFTNRNNEVITINPLLGLNQSDTLIKMSNHQYVLYTVDSAFSIWQFAAWDSIKVFSLSMKDSIHQSIPHPVNQLKIRISKHRGGLTIPKFFDFPTDSGFVQWVGDNVLKSGLYQISDEEVFDFQPGDVFHYRSGITVATPQVMNLWVDSIKQRVNYTGGVQYLVSRNKVTFFPNFPTSYQRDDSIWVSYSYTAPNHTSLAEGQFESIGFNQARIGLRSFNNWSSSLTLPLDPSRLITEYGELFILNNLSQSAEPCFYEYLDMTFPKYYFAKGMGLILNSTLQGSFTSYEALTYAKKGNLLYGTPHSIALILGVENPFSISSGVLLFPNPAKGMIRLSAPKGVFTVSNLQGKRQMSFEVSEESQTVDLNQMAPGIYFYTCQTDDGKILKGKFILE